MKGKLPDSYEKWQRQGVLNKKLKEIKDMVSKNFTQKSIAKVLGMTEKTLIKLKKVHPKLDQAFVYGNDELKHSLVDAILKKALGYEYEETQTTFEETKAGKKKKIVKTKKRVHPDMGAARYLLIIKFGRDFNDKKEEIDALYERIRSKDETWNNANNTETSRRTKEVSKQSKEQ